MFNGVSCLCLTYGRQSLLEESIECFKRQTWNGPKELIIVNDLPEQELYCEEENVTVINIKRRIRTLGEKRNLSVSLAKYDYLFIWDDDDIYLPWRIEETMKKLPTTQFYKSVTAWVLDLDHVRRKPVIENIAPLPSINLSTGRRFSIIGSVNKQEDPCLFFFHGGAAYTRTLFEKVKGYSFLNCGEDLDFEYRIKLQPEISSHYYCSELPDNLIYYMYRGQHGYYHASDNVKYEDICPRVNQRSYTLRPHWKMDYCAIAISRCMDRDVSDHL